MRLIRIKLLAILCSLATFNVSASVIELNYSGTLQQNYHFSYNGFDGTELDGASFSYSFFFDTKEVVTKNGYYYFTPAGIPSPQLTLTGTKNGQYDENLDIQYHAGTRVRHMTGSSEGVDQIDIGSISAYINNNVSQQLNINSQAFLLPFEYFGSGDNVSLREFNEADYAELWGVNKFGTPSASYFPFFPGGEDIPEFNYSIINTKLIASIVLVPEPEGIVYIGLLGFVCFILRNQRYSKRS